MDKSPKTRVLSEKASTIIKRMESNVEERYNKIYKGILNIEDESTDLNGTFNEYLVGNSHITKYKFFMKPMDDEKIRRFVTMLLVYTLKLNDNAENAGYKTENGIKVYPNAAYITIRLDLKYMKNNYLLYGKIDELLGELSVNLNELYRWFELRIHAMLIGVINEINTHKYNSDKRASNKLNPLKKYHNEGDLNKFKTTIFDDSNIGEYLDNFFGDLGSLPDDSADETSYGKYVDKANELVIKSLNVFSEIVNDNLSYATCDDSCDGDSFNAKYAAFEFVFSSIHNVISKSGKCLLASPLDLFSPVSLGLSPPLRMMSLKEDPVNFLYYFDESKQSYFGSFNRLIEAINKPSVPVYQSTASVSQSTASVSQSTASDSESMPHSVSEKVRKCLGIACKFVKENPGESAYKAALVILGAFAIYKTYNPSNCSDRIGGTKYKKRTKSKKRTISKIRIKSKQRTIKTKRKRVVYEKT